MKILTKVVLVLLLLSGLALAAGAVYLQREVLPQLPSIENLRQIQLSAPLRVYDRQGQLLAEFGSIRRIPVRYEELPKPLEQAFLAAEDDGFYEHHGVDPFAIAAAAFELLTTGQKTRGGSTITMQLARNFYLSTEKTYSRKLNEIVLALKIEQELSKAEILTLYLNKIYLGKRAYGVLAAAQIYYGKSTLDELNLAQMAMIAGLPKAPSKYNPINDPERSLQRRDHILGRMLALGYIDQGSYEEALAQPISAEVHRSLVVADAAYVAEMVRAEMVQRYGNDAYRLGHRVYTTIDSQLQSAANRTVRQSLVQYDRRHGFRGAQQTLPVNEAGEIEGLSEFESTQRGNLHSGVVLSVTDEQVEVYQSEQLGVTLKWPEALEWAREYIDENKLGSKRTSATEFLTVGDVVWVEQQGDGSWWLAQVPEVSGALVSISAHDGAIQSLVGGFDFFVSKFNRVVQAERQPGSNFKPFIYSAALDQGMTLATIINDAPVVFEDASLEAAWRPENYSGKIFGPTRLREALVKSRNLVSIRLLRELGIRPAIRYAERFGLPTERMPKDLSLSLGSGGFTPLEIVTAYSVFANMGFKVEPYFISRIENAQGEVEFEASPLLACLVCEQQREAEAAASTLDEVIETPEEIEVSSEAGVVLDTTESEAEPEPTVRYAPRVIEVSNAYLMNSVLREVVRRGTAVRAKVLKRNDLAGKTGTTNDQHDAWFSGYNGDVVTTTWVGFDQLNPLGRRETGSRAALPMWIDYMKVALQDVEETELIVPDDMLSIKIDELTGQRATVGSEKTRFEWFRADLAPPDAEPEFVTDEDGLFVEQPETDFGAMDSGVPEGLF